MGEDSNASFKVQLAQLKAQGASNEKIAHFANDYLDSFIEDSFNRGKLCKESYPLELYMEQFNQFLAAGADKNVRLNFTGTTALMFAASANRPEIFKALVAQDVDPTITDRKGRTAGQQPGVTPEIKVLFEDAVIAFGAQKIK
ncbi:hypothetical protein BH09DEP1_BH09DEP1_5610 [soil metagenome]